MIDEKIKQSIFQRAENAPYLRHLGIELLEIESGKAVMKMPMREELKQPYGVLHGGATASLIDSATAFAIFSLIEQDEIVTTVDVTVHFLRPVTEGFCVCTATVVRAGKRLITVSADVVNEKGKLIATSLSTYTRL